MQLFYDPDVQPGSYRLRDTEAQHAFRVLRKRTGDVLDLTDGRGGWFRGTVTTIDKRNCELDVELRRREAARAPFRLTLLVAPTKNVDRFEWALEKATELGVDRIVPVLTDHGERQRVRADRAARVVETAVKQCLRAWVPEVAELTPLAEALPLADNATGFFPYLGDAAAPLLRDTATAGRDVVIAVGPEGGFSPREADMARDHGYRWVSLGPHRLRTETAVAAAVHALNQVNW